MPPWSGLPLQRGILLQGVEASIFSVAFWVVKWRWHLPVTRLSTCWVLGSYDFLQCTWGPSVEPVAWYLANCKSNSFRSEGLQISGGKKVLAADWDGSTRILKSSERLELWRCFPMKTSPSICMCQSPKPPVSIRNLHPDPLMPLMAKQGWQTQPSSAVWKLSTAQRFG